MLEAKHIIFFLGSAVCVPVGILIALNYRKIHDFVFLFLVFGTCMPDSFMGLPTDINFLYRGWYRGTTRGIEISYLDLLALILLFSSLIVRRREGRRFFWPPSLGLLLAYFAWCLLNVVVFSEPKIFGFFELTKIVRSILLFVAVAAYARSPREIHLFIWALVITIGYEAGVGLRDRYVYGTWRVGATLPHPNSLSMYSLQCLPIFIVTLFAKDASKNLRNACIIAYTAAAGCILLSVSRTGFATLILLSGAGFLLCIGFRLTPRNLGLALLGLVLTIAMVAKSWDSVMSRLGSFSFEQEYIASEQDCNRGAFIRMGTPAIQDNPITGIGLNNWSWSMTNRYAPMVGIDTDGWLPLEPYRGTNIPNEGGRVLTAHNLYLLIIAEVGWPGLTIYMALILYWFWMTGSVLLSKQEDLISRFRLGAFLSIAGVMMQSWTEYGFRVTELLFLGHIIMAVAASLYHYHGKAGKV